MSNDLNELFHPPAPSIPITSIANPIGVGTSTTKGIGSAHNTSHEYHPPHPQSTCESPSITLTCTEQSQPLVLIQVAPLHVNIQHSSSSWNNNNDDDDDDCNHDLFLSSPLAKLHLRQTFANNNNNIINNNNTKELERYSLYGIWDNDEENKQMESNSASSNTNKKENKRYYQYQIKRGIAYEQENNNQTTTTSHNDNSMMMKLIQQFSNTLSDDMTTYIKPLPFIIFPSQDATNTRGIPCLVRIYSRPFCHVQWNSNSSSTRSSSNNNNNHHHQYSSCQKVQIQDDTMVHILPPIKSTLLNWKDQIAHVQVRNPNSMTFIHHLSIYDDLVGQIDCYQDLSSTPPLYNPSSPSSPPSSTTSRSYTPSPSPSSSSSSKSSNMICYEENVIQELTFRMKLLLENPIQVGTTQGAIEYSQMEQKRKKRMSRAVQGFWSRNRAIAARNNNDTDKSSSTTERNKDPNPITPTNPTSTPTPVPNQTNQNINVTNTLFHHGALTVHNSYHGSGKTALVSHIARNVLGCSTVHIINGSALLSKYGTSHTDAALESLLHSIVVTAGVHAVGSKAEINDIHDGGNSSGSGGGNGDEDSHSRINPTSVCIILDHLDTFVPPLSSGVSNRDPALATLNATASYLNNLVTSIKEKRQFPFPTKNKFYNNSNDKGCVFPVRLCLVGIVTCEDDGGYKKASENGSLSGGTKSLVFNSLGDHRFRLKMPSSTLNGAYGTSLQTFDNELEKGKEGTSKDDDDAQKKKKIDLFASVGGNNEAKRALEDALALDVRKNLILARFGMSAPTGVLLYGPPGCGKTIMALATAELIQKAAKEPNNDDHHHHHYRQNKRTTFISLKASDIVRAEVGKSEKLVAAAFEEARTNAPSVIFIDEFQALFTSRGDDGEGGNRQGSGRLSNILLSCMDDITKWRQADVAVSLPLQESDEDDTPTTAESNEYLRSNRVVVLAATNTPWMIDRAFLRSGRFDRVVHIGLPNLSERESILHVHVKRMKLRRNDDDDDNEMDRDDLVKNICKKVAECTDGFSGADIATLCRSAAVRCLNDCNSSGLGVEEHHFVDAKKFDVAASSDDALVRRLKQWRP